MNERKHPLLWTKFIKNPFCVNDKKEAAPFL